MRDSLSDNSLVRTEQKIRNKNVGLIEAIKKYFRNDKSVKQVPLEFDCECSDPTCNKHVRASVDTYEQTHHRQDRFIVASGHDTASIEKVVADKSDYVVVEKEDLNP